MKKTLRTASQICQHDAILCIFQLVAVAAIKARFACSDVIHVALTIVRAVSPPMDT